MLSLDKLRKKTINWTFTIFNVVNQQNVALKQQREELDDLKNKLETLYNQ